MSYCGRLDFGIVADREQMRDVWKLIDWLGESLDERLPVHARPYLAARARPERAQEPAARAQTDGSS